MYFVVKVALVHIIILILELMKITLIEKVKNVIHIENLLLDYKNINVQYVGLI